MQKRDKNISQFFRNFHRDEEGGLMIMFGVGFMLLLLAVGGAIEFGEAIVVKSKIGGAIDSAALSAAVAPKTTDQNAVAKRYFESNYTSTAGTTVKYDSLNVSGIGGSTITIKANANMNTTLLRVNGINEIPVNNKTVVQTDSTATLPDVDMVVVADNSGSMKDDNRLVDLKSALRNVLTTLKLNDSGTAPNVRIGISIYNYELVSKNALTSKKSTTSSIINNMWAADTTCGACGLQGASDLFNSKPAPQTARDDGSMYSSNKMAVFMTDGMQNTTLEGVYSGSDLYEDNADAHSQTLEQCNALKSAGVTVYTIGFSASSQDPGNIDTLTKCASTGPDGKPLTYYAPDGNTLNDIFGMIASTAMKLRIVE